MELIENGYITFKVYDKNTLHSKRNTFLSECKQFQEFNKLTNLYVLGGFSAFGNPSSFHNTFVRENRLNIYNKSKTILENLYPSKKIELLFDRMLLRKTGTSPSRESWHRDISPIKNEDDIIFGGWVNFDDESNYFSCVPKSHIKNSSLKTGFAKIDKKSDEFKELNKSRKKIEIEPGFAILFFQDIVHEVLSTKLKFDSYRIFHSLRITDSSEALYNKNDIIKNQSVPPLPSNQIPPMYAKLHWTNWLEKLENFSQFIHENCKENILRLTTNTTHNIVQKNMKSLLDYGFKLYPEYTEYELSLYFPIKL